MRVFPAAAPNMIIYTKRFLWLFSYTVSVEKPRIRRCSPPGKFPRRYPQPKQMWACEGAGQFGYGRTPHEAWNDWANWALV
jgi:hypothetical protein